MTQRQIIGDIFKRRSDGRGAFWLGHPNDETIPVYEKKWGVEPTRESLYRYFNDPSRWITADAGYKPKDGRPAFDPTYGTNPELLKNSLGLLHGTELISELDKLVWPDASDCDFTDIYREIERYPDKMVFTGMWSPFFHIVADFFGMENYFINMYENPDIVDAVTEHVVGFFVEANEKFFAGLGDRADAMFFGNDLGTQRDLFLSPEMFRRFILPSIKRLVAVGKKYNKTIMMHSCGSIYRIIPDLIDAGIDVLHPIQAQAAGMNAKELAQYKNDLSFLGGLDAQTFFVNATPAQVKDEVRRVRDILSPNIVISPSHEEILPNVPADNVSAMVEAATE